jgi:AcrR family transcriptional regulator
MIERPDKKTLTRARIIDTATKAILRSGYHGIGVVDIMKGAGLTHGGFYAHFATRTDLLVEVAATASKHSLAKLNKAADSAPPELGLQAVLDSYLSDRHLNAPEHGCPIAALGGEMPRQAPEVRATATHGIEQLARLLTSKMPTGHQDDALGMMSCMVGALVLARAVDDPVLSAAIRDSAQHFIRTALHLDATSND